MNSRRSFFKTLIGAAVATIAAPIICSVEEKLPKRLIPLVRRVWPNMLASEIVGIRPLDGPTGQVFYMTHKYEEKT